LCRQFIGIDTSPQSGTREAALWLQKLAISYEMKVEVQEETLNGIEQANIFIRRDGSSSESNVDSSLESNNESTIGAMTQAAPSKKEEFLLLSHFDTADPGSPSLWTENMLNPFHGIIKDGKLYGLGACEAKIDLICKIEALNSFDVKQKWKIEPVVVGTFGEELGMHGLLRAMRKNKFSTKLALVGEPSGQRLIYAGKGYAVLDFYIPFSKEERKYRIEHNLKESVSTQSKLFKGTATHSSDGLGVENAINKAMEYLIQIPESIVIMEIEGGSNHNMVASHATLEIDVNAGVSDPMVKKLRFIYGLMQEIGSDFLINRDEEFNPGHPTMNLGLIKSHEDHVHITVACRFPPSVNENDYNSWLDRVQIATTKVGGECRVSDYKRPYRTDLNSDFVKTCLNVLSSKDMIAECVALPTCTEMTLLERKGIVSLGFGAGTRKDSPSFSNQFVNINDLEKSIEFYKAMIERVCL